ncbi:unnamed protein product [Ostreobium quekettii]|uniref:Vacuolar transporter chaperone 4 n=1 Tax=Ostreobium quekettii TaxID=121088 RepID=A0A8S1J9R6_9CHLO|nr:unnamed protein product [Ostreobium quekettii]
MENYLMGGIAYDPILVNLSDAYSQLKALREKALADGTVWNAPEVFERKTVKYWVHPANVLRVKCMLIKHLPILIYGAGKGQADAKSRLSSLKEQTQKDGTLISSVYFDNDELQTYHDRIRREHGSSLTRIRWYNKRVLTDDMETFIERKIHGDSWTGIKSVKERSPMPATQVPRFINGEHVEAMDAEGSKGERLLDIQTKVFHERREEPNVRTEYVRVAFQESSSNEVRISLDSHVRMIREKGVPRGPTGWHRDVVKSEPQPKDVVNFPYSILETKVASEEPPEWVQEILNTGMLVEVPKFSKFLHGTALLFGDSVSHSPFWFVPDDHDRYTPATIAEMADQSDVYDKKAGQRGAQAPHQAGTTSNRVELSEIIVAQSSQTAAGAREVIPVAEPDTATKKKMKSKGVDKKSVRTAALVRTRIEPKTFFANERTFLAWLTISVLVMFMGLTLLDGASLVGGATAESVKPCEEDNSCRVREISGVLISPMALVLMAYSLYQYRRRNIQILRRETVRFDDQRGPVLITGLLLAILITAFVISARAKF